MNRRSAARASFLAALACGVGIQLLTPSPVLADEPATAGSQDGGAAPTPPTPSAGGTARASGEALYRRVCGRCHPGGEEDTGPRIRDRRDPEADAIRVIREGKGRMRAIRPARLSDADLPVLIEYLRTTLHAVR